MKDKFPDYRHIGVASIENSLSQSDKNILDKHLKFCSMTAGEKKVKDIKRAMLQIRDVIEKDYDKWARDEAIGFTALLNNSHLTASTKKEYMCRFKQFAREQYKDLNMLLGIKLKRERSIINQTKINDENLIKPDELERLLRAAESLRDKAMLTALFETGARPEELMKLKWKDIKFNHNHAVVSLFSGKTDSARDVPIKESVIHLNRWKQEYCFPNRKDSDFIFPSKEKGKLIRDRHMQSGSLGHLIKRIAKRANIERPIYPYLFRHSRLNTLYKQIPEPVARKFGGHSPRSNMAAVYSHINNKDVVDVMLEKVFHIEELTDEQKHDIKYAVEALEIDRDNKDKKINALAHQNEMLQAQIEQLAELIKAKKPISR